MNKPFSWRLASLLGQAAHLLRQETLKSMECSEVIPRSMGVLELLASKGGLTQQEVGQTLGIDRTSIVMLVDDLEQKGFVVREKHPNDRRCHSLVLTAKGIEAQKKIVQAAELAEGRVLSKLTLEERQTLRALLEQALMGENVEPCSGIEGPCPGEMADGQASKS